MLDMEILACMGGSPKSPQLLKRSRDNFMHFGMVKFNEGGKASLVCKAKFSLTLSDLGFWTNFQIFPFSSTPLGGVWGKKNEIFFTKNCLTPK